MGFGLRKQHGASEKKPKFKAHKEEAKRVDEIESLQNADFLIQHIYSCCFLSRAKAHRDVDLGLQRRSEVG